MTISGRWVAKTGIIICQKKRYDMCTALHWGEVRRKTCAQNTNTRGAMMTRKSRSDHVLRGV